MRSVSEFLREISLPSVYTCSAWLRAFLLDLSFLVAAGQSAHYHILESVASKFLLSEKSVTGFKEHDSEES